MTEIEAIKELERGYLGDTEEIVQAKHMGIKALEEMQKLKELGDCYIIPKSSHWEINGVDVQKALEKQIEKKPIKDKEFSSLFECPSCGRRQKIMYEQNYCKVCGQKLDWGNEDD